MHQAIDMKQSHGDSHSNTVVLPFGRKYLNLYSQRETALHSQLYQNAL